MSVTASDIEWEQLKTNDNEWLFRLIRLFPFFGIREEPTTKQPEEKLFSIEEDLEEDQLN